MMKAQNLLRMFGAIDGAVSALAAAWGSYVDPAHTERALVVGGIAGAVGSISLALARILELLTPVKGNAK